MLLRAIQERRYRPVGAKEDKTANVRIVAATNEDLQKAVTEKRFRQDLPYRLQEYVTARKTSCHWLSSSVKWQSVSWNVK